MLRNVVVVVVRELKPGSHIPPVATDNGRRSVPVGPRRICAGSPTYSNLREM